MVIEAMAERYSMLPSEVLSKGTTVDLQFFSNASVLRDREAKKARGESIADTFSQDEIMQMYKERKKQ